MFEQTSRLAEKVATSVSRRRFLGSLGRWAAAAAVGLAGLLTGTAAGGSNGEKKGVCCTYQPIIDTPIICCAPEATTCPPTCGGQPLMSSKAVKKCSDCGEVCVGC